jgi:D-glycero-D-manno-heptose 1,7-bisphosphate phosphatase
MLLEAAHDLGIDLQRSFMVGDQCSDVEAGIRAGVKASILIRAPGTGAATKFGAALVAADFAETTDFILKRLDE